jgi:hypothetical protein
MKKAQNFRFPVPEAAGLASLVGIDQDLLGVLDYCKVLDDRQLEDWNHVEWDAISSAIVVRYARCFAQGVRGRLEGSLLSDAPDELREAHDFFIEMRNKHVAHSVNAFEENEVCLSIGDGFVSSEEIDFVGSTHGRVSGLSFGGPALMRRLVNWVRERVEEEKTKERAAILRLARTRPLSELKSYGIPQIGDAGDSSGVRKRRPRP